MYCMLIFRVGQFILNNRFCFDPFVTEEPAMFLIEIICGPLWQFSHFNKKIQCSVIEIFYEILVLLKCIKKWCPLKIHNNVYKFYPVTLCQ
ncbi:hypothetical protein FKM82_019914 [Ascaphus truei]